MNIAEAVATLTGPDGPFEIVVEDVGGVPTKVYKSPLKDEYDFYKNTVSDVQDANAQTTASAQNALNTVGYWSGKINLSNVNLYTGNYLNYLIGVCGGDPTCQEPKMKVAQDVVNFLLDNVHGVRFGVMTFWYACGSSSTSTPPLAATSTTRDRARVVAAWSRRSGPTSGP